MGIIEHRSQIEVMVVKDMSAMMQAMAIRSAVFIGEFGCSHGEEFDGNDFSATHIIAHVDGEPAGAMRLRYYNDFVILERLAVLPGFRRGRFGGRGVAYALATFGFNLSRMKGFKRFVGFSVLGLEQFWGRVAIASSGRVDKFGTQPIECSGSICIGVFGSLDPLPGAVDSRESHQVLTVCEAELPTHVMQRALLQSDLGAMQLPASDNRRGHDPRRGDRRGADQRGGDRRATERRAHDRRALDRRAPDRRAPEHRGSDSIGQDQRFGDRRADERRTDERRAGDRRAGDRRASERRHAEAQATPDQRLHSFN